MDPRIVDFIREHRTRLTRKAITRQLEDAGYPRDEIDRAWAAAANEPAASGSGPLNWYIWIVYGLGAVAIVVFAVANLAYPSYYSGFRQEILTIGWVAAYVLLSGAAAWWLTRHGPRSVVGSIAMVIVAPVIFVLIGGGICYATILFFIQVL